MPSIARVGDPISCSDTIASGSSDVYLNGLPVARQGDTTTGHSCYPSTTLIGPFAQTVFANGLPVALKQVTKIQTHCCVHPNCHDGVVQEASLDSFAENTNV